jgi:hypothetical protein
MCQLQFTIQTNDIDGDSIKAVQMRYRPALIGGTWIVEGYLGITNITNATILQTPNLTIDGTYEFEIQVQDANDEWSAWFSDPNNPTFKIGGCVNKPPVANAGIDQTITLPNDSVMLTGINSSDSDGSIASFSWTKETSLASTITNANSAEASVTGMEAGTHVFKLTVTDDGDDNGENKLTDTDTVQIVVEPAVKPSKPYYVGLGNCRTAPTGWTEVWTLKGNLDTPPFYIPVVGDVFYTDSSLTKRYEPASPSHILGFSEPPNVLQEDKSYNIDSNGEVISIINCDTPSEGDGDTPKEGCDPGLECCFDDGSGVLRPAVGDEPCI